MKRLVSVTALCTMVLVAAMPILAETPAKVSGKDVSMTGYITDEWCGKANANEKGKDCAIACAKKGAALVLFSGEKAYKLSDQKAAMANVGIEVVVSGTMADDGSIVVKSIEKAAKKA